MKNKQEIKHQPLLRAGRFFILVLGLHGKKIFLAARLAGVFS